MRKKLIGVVLAALVLTASACANVIFTLGNNPQPNEENVMFHTAMTGSTISGTTNHTHTTVVFTSSQTLHASGGQSDVDPVTPPLLNVTITVPGEEFNDYIFNPFKNTGNSNISVIVTTSDGHTFSFGPYGGNGNNFLTITTSGGEEISKILLTAAGPQGIAGLRQNRISGIQVAPPIPEPSSMLLLGSGVLVLAQVLRRKLS